jgi:hypothetical protein
MLNDFIVRHKSTFSDFMEIYVEIFSTSTDIFFRIKFRNCTKSGKANAEIFSELARNNLRIFQYFPNKGGSFQL